jgi:ribosomal protein S18 acetylase RimI-like enzyme
MENQVKVFKIMSKNELELNLECITDTLSKAFYNDPYYVYIMPDNRKRIAQIKWWMKIFLYYAFKNGEIYITPDCKGISVWMGPDKPALDNFQLAQLGLILYPLKIGIRNFVHMLNVSNEWEEFHARQDKNHYYLFVIGVDPEMQRRGYGKSLMKIILDRADKEGVKCYLETVTQENVMFYEDLQFQSIKEKKFGENYNYWVMTRDPQK